VPWRAAVGVGFVFADDLAGDGGGVAAAEEEVAEHVDQRAAFGPGEVAVRLDAGGVSQGEEDRGDGVRRGGGVGAQDPVAVDFDAADGEGVAEVGGVDDVDLQEEDVGAAGDGVGVALFVFLGGVLS
jgi:hypothetical protein